MLNIKSQRAHDLARELAALEGTTLTEAVTSALEAALDEHVRRRQIRRQVLQGLIASARAQGVAQTSDPFAELYDDMGLPR